MIGVDIDNQALAGRSGQLLPSNRSHRHATLVRTRLEAGAFDIVVANILSNPLKLLAPALLARVAPGGALALVRRSGATGQ